MEYPKILFGKFCTMIRHEQSVWTLNSKLPDQNLSGKKFPVKIEKVLQAPIIFFPQIGTGVYHWNPPTKEESMQWVHKVRFPPQKSQNTIFWAEEGILLIERW
jgi:hypothetical protein